MLSLRSEETLPGEEMLQKPPGCPSSNPTTDESCRKTQTVEMFLDPLNRFLASLPERINLSISNGMGGPELSDIDRNSTIVIEYRVSLNYRISIEFL